MLEKQLEAWCRKYALLHGCLFYKWNSPSQRGVADRILLAPGGVVVFVELKRPDKTPKLTTLQQLHRDDILNMGHRHEVINEKEQFKTLINSITS